MHEHTCSRPRPASSPPASPPRRSSSTTTRARAPPRCASPLNSMVIRAAEPVVVDTGMAENREQYLADVFGLVDPEDIRWVFISHDDVDHTGNVNALMDGLRQRHARRELVHRDRMGASLAVSPTRQRWVGDGEAFDVGDRVLRTVRPPIFDSPTTRGLFDPTTGVYWGSDSFATPMPARSPTPTTSPTSCGCPAWRPSTTTSPRWLPPRRRRQLPGTVDRVAALDPTVLVGCHTPVVRGASSPGPSSNGSHPPRPSIPSRTRPPWRTSRPASPSRRDGRSALGQPGRSPPVRIATPSGAPR